MAIRWVAASPAGLADKIGPNPYINELKGQIADDAITNSAEPWEPGRTAQPQGMSGSSGYRDPKSTPWPRTWTRTPSTRCLRSGFNSFNQGIQNQLNLAGMMDRNQQGAMGNLQNIQTGVTNQFNPAMLGQQMAGNYAQTIGGPTVPRQQLWRVYQLQPVARHQHGLQQRLICRHGHEQRHQQRLRVRCRKLKPTALGHERVSAQLQHGLRR